MTVAPDTPTLPLLSHKENAQLRKRSDAVGTLLVLHAWAVIALCMAVFALWPNPFTLVVCSALIGGRQLGLSILMHDAAHRVLMRQPVRNDVVGHWLCGGAVGAHMYDYRPYHLSHHRHTQQDQDPDLVLSAPFPVSAASLRRKVLRDMLGITGMKQRMAQMQFGMGDQGSRLTRLLKLVRHEKAFVLCNCFLFALLWWLNQAMLYVWMWLLPLLTWYQLFSRIRNIAEHAVTGDRNNRLRNTRTTFANLFERAFVAPYWVNYHLEHHLYTFVPCWKLRQAHRLLIEQGLGPQMELSPGYASVLRKAVAPR
jgi:fatty acid desaturase